MENLEWLEELLSLIGDYFLESITIMFFFSMIFRGLSKMFISMGTTHVMYKCDTCRKVRSRKKVEVTKNALGPQSHGKD